jgi:hypothetical protein
MMELPKRHSTPSEGGRFAPIKSSDYGGRPLTGPTVLTLRLLAAKVIRGQPGDIQRPAASTAAACDARASASSPGMGSRVASTAMCGTAALANSA